VTLSEVTGAPQCRQVGTACGGWPQSCTSWTAGSATAPALSWFSTTGAYSSTKAALWSVTNTLRLELAAQGTQVVGAHLGYTDTPLTAGLDVDKEDPRDIVAAIYDGLEAGDYEVLADDTSRRIKQNLSQPLTALYPQLANAK
jgi:NAD(P)-dependent dehydrogenase (short-subunit alcohol dehydrogenase family)